MSHPVPSLPPAVADDLSTRLRGRGLRVTQQRREVLAAVRGLGHATPEQIHASVADADLTTVYRTLELLEEIGLVRHAHLGHGAPSFRPADDDHVHVVCHRCGSVVDVAPDLVDHLEARLLADQEFRLDRAHFTVFGTCRACAADDRAGADRPAHTHGSGHGHGEHEHSGYEHHGSQEATTS